MRNLSKVLAVLGWCLLGVIIGVVGVQAGTGNASGTDNGSSIANLLTSTDEGDSLIVTTTSISSITTTTASSGGSVSVVGEATVSTRGVCWSTSANPTTDNSNTTNGSGAGSFTSNLTGLTPGTLYHVRAYAVYIEEPAKSMYTYYGGDSTFTTLTTPTVTTTTITSITSTTASGGGNVTADGGDSVTVRGVCWSTSANPTTDDSKTTDGSDTGAFTSSLTSLTPATLYHVRAYATNSIGTSYGGDSSFTTLTTPTVTTATITSITSTTASGGGNVTSDGGASVTARGVCWSTSANPTTSDSKTTDGTGTGVFTSSLTSLTPATLYHVRAYATNSVGTSYGGDSSFTTLTTPTVTTATITSITSTTASGGGNVTSDGGASVTARGVCWSTSANPTTSDSKTTNGTGTGAFTSSLTSLTPGTLYHVRAYATNSVGTSYGGDSSFTTLTTPTVTTATITSITSTTASGGGNVTSDGGSSITARGVCWSTSANPTTADSKTTDGTGTGAFTSSLTSLTPGTLYHERAYATNSVSTSYGGDSTFTTLITPTVTTATITSITSTTASGGGNVIASGGASVTARGVCWSTSVNPTTADSKTTDGTGTGAFTSSLTSLTPATLYHVRAYATNSVGTAYGGDSTFTTLTTPTVTTAAITSISSTTASSGGNVTSSGGATVTARGVCWSTSANPTTADSKTTNGTGTGAFTSSLTGLTPTTLYHVRAYATNSVGTAYGGDSTFTTINKPTVTTTAITSITSTTASSGGNVTASGGDSVTARGVCWSNSTSPTVADSHTINGAGTGTFTSSITGLVPDTTYYVRAYATNRAGTGYGSQVSFTTLQAYTISGYVLTSDSTGIDSVLMDGLPGDPQTDADGYYTAIVDSGWSGTVKPTLENYAFDPESTIYSDVTGDQDTNFIGRFTKFIISGHVRQGGEGVEGVVMNGLPGDPQTDTTGYYRVIVDPGSYWTVIPTADGCTFQPDNRIYTSVSTDYADQDYTETCFSEGIDPDKDNFVPKEYQLSRNQPNPFNPTTEISFGLPKNSHVTLRIYNVVGQEVITLLDRNLSAGTYHIMWNGLDNSGRTVSSGVYFYRMQAGDYVQTRQMLLLK